MKSIMKRSLTILVCFALVLGLFLPVTASAYLESSSSSSAISALGLKAGDTGVLVRNTNLRSIGSTRGKVILTAAKGTKVTISNSYNYWYKVKLANGKTGFMIKRNIKASTAVVPAAPNGTGSTATKWNVEKTMVLATTTSTQDTGLLDYLIPIFEKKYGVSVKVISVGTGEAIAMGKRGDADVLLVHARSQEDAFVASGYGVNRKDVMHNEFFIVGPKDDPAKIAGESNAVTAMKKIAAAKATFISRGDKSGTNTKELSIWKTSGITPQGESWYKESAQGMGDTLMMASELGAYTLVDSGTWYAYMNKINLYVVTQGDSNLANPYGVIAVSKDKYPNIHYNAAMAFEEFITSPEGQKDIASFIKNGHRLFYPDAK